MKEVYLESMNHYTIKGFIPENYFWAKISTMKDIFYDGIIDAIDVNCGRYYIKGKSVYGFLDVNDDACLGSYCGEDCMTCNRARRNYEYVLLPEGLIIYDKNNVLISSTHRSNQCNNRWKRTIL